MTLSETIKCLVEDGYKIRFESNSRFLMTITLSNGRVFSCRDSYTSVMNDENLRKTLEYMKKDVDREVEFLENSLISLRFCASNRRFLNRQLP